MKIKITVKKISEYKDLISQYENPLENACFMKLNQEFISIDGKMPKGFCKEAWISVGPFVRRLAKGENNFFDGWMKNVNSAMISCNDGFRPVSFYLEIIK